MYDPKKGELPVTIEVRDEKLWAGIKDGTVTGISMGGTTFVKKPNFLQRLWAWFKARGLKQQIIMGVGLLWLIYMGVRFGSAWGPVATLAALAMAARARLGITTVRQENTARRQMHDREIQDQQELDRIRNEAVSRARAGAPVAWDKQTTAPPPDGLP